MPFVSVTRLHLRSAWGFLPFIWHTFRSNAQAKRAPGYLGGCLNRDAHGAYWTVTVWESREAMMAFRGSGAHRAAMPRIADLSDEAAYTHWEQPTAQVPDWRTAHARLLADPHFTKLPHASEAHRQRKLPAAPAFPGMRSEEPPAAPRA